MVSGSLSLAVGGYGLGVCVWLAIKLSCVIQLNQGFLREENYVVSKLGFKLIIVSPMLHSIMALCELSWCSWVCLDVVGCVLVVLPCPHPLLPNETSSPLHPNQYSCLLGPASAAFVGPFNSVT